MRLVVLISRQDVKHIVFSRFDRMKSFAIFVIAVILEVSCSKRTMKDIVRTLKFGNCDESFSEKTEKSHFENITITNVGKGFNVFNGQFVHKREVEGIYALYTTYRCESPTQDNCELAFNDKHDDYCDILVRPGEYWSPLWGAFHPKAKCPLLKNTYHITNGTIGAEKLLAFGKGIPNFRNSYWVTKTHMYTNDTKENFACMSMTLQIAQIRV
ncbi:hypothetical protein GE061_019271 [Apolygus lucorum]|uniref:MD-2-related lipid-recognition domain-containing protein n=1 Tax=Apolygus lucorum TaxID=248454 RepID=A0A6A4JRH6_APOLU|nr:hypothetical protein GE061_019271 [Apolygus lucorum]